MSGVELVVEQGEGQGITSANTVLFAGMDVRTLLEGEFWTDCGQPNGCHCSESVADCDPPDALPDPEDFKLKLHKYG